MFSLERVYMYLILLFVGDMGKMQEMSLITADSAYYTCLGDFDPRIDDPVPENSNSNLEVGF